MPVEMGLPSEIARILYGRVSSEDQADAGTIETQREALRAYARLMGFPVLAEFWDDGVSGTLPLHKRPGGEQLLACAAENPGASVLFHRLDRFGRTLDVILDGHKQLEAAGVAIESMLEKFDTGTTLGRLLFHILGTLAEFFRSNMLDTVTAGRDRVARDCRYTGGPIPYGYDVVPRPDGGTGGGVFVPSQRVVPELGERPTGEPTTEADLMVDIFRRIATGGSLLGECQRLNAQGLTVGRRYGGQAAPASPGPWLPSSLAAMIHNPFYKGERPFKSSKGVIQQTPPPLVSPAVWDAAQEQLKENLSQPKGNARRVYPLRGLIRCGACQSVYVGGAGGGSHAHPQTQFYYRCGGSQGAHNPDPSARCRAPSVPALALEAAMWEQAKGFARDPKGTLAQVEARLVDQQAAVRDTTAERARLGRRLTALDGQRTAYSQQQAAGLITLDELRARFEELNASKAEVQRELDALRTEAELAAALASAVRRADDALGELRASVDAIEAERDPVARAEQQGELLRRLLSQIRVDAVSRGEGKRQGYALRVHWVFDRETKSEAVSTTEQPTGTSLTVTLPQSALARRHAA